MDVYYDVYTVNSKVNNIVTLYQLTLISIAPVKIINFLAKIIKCCEFCVYYIFM